MDSQSALGLLVQISHGCFLAVRCGGMAFGPLSKAGKGTEFLWGCWGGSVLVERARSRLEDSVLLLWLYDQL